MHLRACCLSYSISVLVILAATGLATSAQNQVGTPPFGSFAGGPDVVNLANLNTHFNIPIISKPGRGLSANFSLSYDSLVWYPVTSGSSTTWQPVSGWGWSAGSPFIGFVTAKATGGQCSSGINHYLTVTYTNFAYIDGIGTGHQIPGTLTYKPAQCGGPSAPITALTTDGSGWTIYASMSSGGVPTTTATSSDGTIMTTPNFYSTTSGTAQDRNGNQITKSAGTYTDTLGQTALTVSGSVPTVDYAYTAPAGSTQVAVTYLSYTVQTYFLAGITEYPRTANYLVDKITYPDHSYYQFQYEQTPAAAGCSPIAGTQANCVTGRIASVQLPTGGIISYSYSGGYNGIFADGSTATLTRTTPDGTWKYAQVKGTAAASTTTVTDPTTNVSTIQFQSIYETQRVVNQGSSSTLLTTNTCYNASASPCTSTAVTLPITQRQEMNQLPGSKNLTDLHVQYFDNYGDLTEQDDYDYGPPMYLFRKTTIAYASLGKIQSFTQTETVTDTNNNQVSKTVYNYDGASVQSTSGTPQHVTVSGPRGNLTSVNFYTSTSNSLTKSMTYFDTGNVQTATDVNGAVTTYNYGTDTNANCGNAFPVSISEPLSLSRSYSWNCAGGVQTSVTDENNQTSTTSYTDPYFWRPASAKDATNAVTSYSYATSAPYNWVESSLPVVSGSSVVDIRTTVDSLGRRILSQRKQSSSANNYDTVETDYDNLGRVKKASLPFSTTAGSTNSSAAGMTIQYDVFGRRLSVSDVGGASISYSYSQNDVLATLGPAPNGENTKQRQFEFNAFGQLTSVCEVTGLVGSGPCGQNNAANGYLTKYAVNAAGQITNVSQNAQNSGAIQTRSYSYDLLGRLISENNPESGTTTYTYDSSSTSGCQISSAGDLMLRTNAAGVYSCYNYDALHRLLSVGHNDGITGSKFFIYDAATVNGVPMTNSKGHLAEAYTCITTCSPKTTDEGFGYTVRGEVSDLYESTPNSGGYYHSAATYWPNGVLNQLNSYFGSTLLYFAAWNVDGEGRVYSNYNMSLNPVTATTYNSASQPTQISYSSGDSDSYVYDANTNRMTQYKFNVGTTGQSIIGNMAWNAIGTLAGLTIADSFSSANTQTCGYTHDDLVRIASVNCGTDQNQWSANGGSNIHHLCGRADGDGWSVNVAQDTPPCFMQYGPYYSISATGSYLAQWNLQVDNNNNDNNTILTLDIFDDTTQTVITSMSITREQFANALTYQTFSLPFTISGSNAGHTFEFRVDWKGFSYLKEQSLDYASNGTWSQTFAYDAFGNMSKSGSMSFAAQYPAAPPYTNHMTSIGGSTPTYDANGNVTNDFLHTYGWNADGRPTTIDGIGVTYDALGRMLEQSRSGSHTQFVYSPTGFEMLVMNGSSRQNAFVPLPGGAEAIYPPSGTYIRHADWLGSSRFTSNLASRTMYSDGAYGPFGEPYAQSGSIDLSFTGMNQDTVANLYDFPAREYGTQGRWPSPDPAGSASADPGNPQSWNRYAYVFNIPDSLVDPSGLNPLDDPCHFNPTQGCYQKVFSTFLNNLEAQGCLSPAYVIMPGACNFGVFSDVDVFDLIGIAFTASTVPNPDFMRTSCLEWWDCGPIPATIDTYPYIGVLGLIPIVGNNGTDGSNVNSYLREIGRQLAPLVKLSDCTGEAVVNQVPFGSKVFGTPPSGSDPVGTALEAGDKLTDNKYPAMAVWGLNKAGLPALSEAVENGLTKVVSALAPLGKFISGAGLGWQAYTFADDTVTCYNKPKDAAH